jgi:hypothetical protein
MPIDASVYSQLGHGVTPIDPVGSWMRADQDKHLNEQTKAMSLQNIASQQALDDSSQLRDLAKNSATQDDYEYGLLKLGTPAALKAHQELVLSRLATTKAQREANIAQLLQQKQENDAASGVTGGLLALPPEQRPAAWPLALQKLAEVNPEKASAVAQKYPQYPGDAVATQMHQFTQTEAQRLSEQTQNALQQHQSSVLGETKRHNLESEKTARIAAEKPPASLVLQAMNDVPTDFDPSKPLADPGREAFANEMGRGERQGYDPTTRTPHAGEMNARGDWLAKKNGFPGLLGPTAVNELKVGKEEFGPKGRNGQVLQSVNVAAQHLDLLEQLGEALKNGNNQVANEITNKLKTRISGAASATNYAAVQLPVLSEILRIVKGAGMINEKEMERMLKISENSNSPGQIAGVIDNLVKIMGARPRAMEQIYGNYFRGHSVSEKLLPEVNALFARHGVSVGQGPGSDPSLAPEASQGSPSPSATGGLPPGVKEQGQEGAVKWYRWASDGKRHTALPPSGGAQ